MRGVSLTHTVLASLLWCAAVFVFVGMNFMKYEAASRALRETRIETAMKNLGTMIQIEMDKGEALADLKNAEILMRQFVSDDPELMSVSVFDSKQGKTLFSLSGEKAGSIVPDSWRKKCVLQDTLFTEKDKKSEISGLPLFNAFLENKGCLVARYETKPYETIREEMIKTAFRFTFRLSAVGVLICFCIYFYGFLISSVLANKKVPLTIAVSFVTTLLVMMICFGFSAMFYSFEADIKKGIADKTRLIARQIGNKINHVVQNGVPLDSVTALEAYMDGMRQNNQEILFILVTDKAGKVLYESGTAAKAFESDPLTGRISLRKGYYNAAAPVGAEGAVAGWVQIGVNERFVREKNL